MVDLKLDFNAICEKDEMNLSQSITVDSSDSTPPSLNISKDDRIEAKMKVLKKDSAQNLVTLYVEEV